MSREPEPHGSLAGGGERARCRTCLDFMIRAGAEWVCPNHPAVYTPAEEGCDNADRAEQAEDADADVAGVGRSVAAGVGGGDGAGGVAVGRDAGGADGVRQEAREASATRLLAQVLWTRQSDPLERRAFKFDDAPSRTHYLAAGRALAKAIQPWLETSNETVRQQAEAIERLKSKLEIDSLLGNEVVERDQTIRQQAEAIERVRALHVPEFATGEVTTCYFCGEDYRWPCKTLRALAGER